MIPLIRDIGIGFILGSLFLASIYPIFLGNYKCPDFLSIDTCNMSTYHALVVDIIATSIFTIILAYYIYEKTKQSTQTTIQDTVRFGMQSLSEDLRNNVFGIRNLSEDQRHSNL